MSKKIIKAIVVIVVLAVVYFAYSQYQAAQAAERAKFATGNGRLEATEVYVTSDLGGEIAEILVERGALVKKGDLLVKMDTRRLRANRASAVAKMESKKAVKQSEEANVQVAQCEVTVAQAGIEQQKSLLVAVQSRYERVKGLVAKEAETQQTLENAQANYESTKAQYEAAEATLAQKQANLAVSQAKVAEAAADIAEAEADIASIDVDLEKSNLYASRDGRIQYNLAYAGEVISAGGRVLNLADMTDVYLAFFLPARQAGKLAIGTEARIVLDALPQYPIPAAITFVASTAQFTPKTVETEVEREKLMFRVEARVDETLLQKHIEYIKTGMPGVAWVKLDDGTEWPANLQFNVPAENN